MKSSVSRQSDNRHPFATYRTHNAEVWKIANTRVVTKITRILFFINQLSAGSQLVSLVIFRAQAHLLYSRHHPQGGTRPLWTFEKNHGALREIKDTRYSQNTFHISYQAALVPSSHLDFLRRSDLPRILPSSRPPDSSNHVLSLNSRLWRAPTSKRLELSQDTREQPWRREGLRDRSIDRSIGRIDRRIPAGNLSRENARHECGTLWCVRGTVVRTLNSVGTPHPHSVAAAVGRAPLCATTCTCTHTATWHVGVLKHEGGTSRAGRDGTKKRNRHVESTEVRQKWRDVALRKQREMEKDRAWRRGC